MRAACSVRGSGYTIRKIDAHIGWRDKVQGDHLGLSWTMRRACGIAPVAAIIQIVQHGIGAIRLRDVAGAEAWFPGFVPAGRVACYGLNPGCRICWPGGRGDRLP